LKRGIKEIITNFFDYDADTVTRLFPVSKEFIAMIEKIINE